MLKKLIKQLLKNKGFQIKRYPDIDIERRLKIIKTYNINLLLDIGANAGQYAMRMREYGYKNKIISFEPVSDAFNYLEHNAKYDSNWFVKNYAIGDENKNETIHLAGNSYSSSLLKMLPQHKKSAPKSVYVDDEVVQVKQLDKVLPELIDDSDNIMLKIDTQGYEKRVLMGAQESLKKIKIIQLEMSLVPLYEDELLFVDMINYLKTNNFQLFSLENGFSDSVSGQLLQVDGIFVKRT